jgi:hypothetical protein
MDRREATWKAIKLIREGALPNDPRFAELTNVDLEAVAYGAGAIIPKWDDWDADEYFENYRKEQGKK